MFPKSSPSTMRRVESHPSEGSKVDIGSCSSLLPPRARLLLLVQGLDHHHKTMVVAAMIFTFCTANIILSRRRAARFVSLLLPSCVGGGTTWEQLRDTRRTLTNLDDLSKHRTVYLLHLCSRCRSRGCQVKKEKEEERKRGCRHPAFWWLTAPLDPFPPDEDLVSMEVRGWLAPRDNFHRESCGNVTPHEQPLSTPTAIPINGTHTKNHLWWYGW